MTTRCSAGWPSLPSVSQDSAALASTQAAAAKTSFSLPGECLKAANILKAFLGASLSLEALRGKADGLTRYSPTSPARPQADPSHPQSALNAIPKAVLLNAKGIAVFQVVKAGFIFSGKGGSPLHALFDVSTRLVPPFLCADPPAHLSGTGLVVARLPDGEWSAPSLIMTGGLGWGLQVGADITDFVVVLNSDEAVRAFSMGGNVTIGGNVSAAAGPVGTGASVQTALASPAACFSYSKSKGLFAGLSLEVRLSSVRSNLFPSSVPPDSAFRSSGTMV